MRPLIPVALALAASAAAPAQDVQPFAPVQAAPSPGYAAMLPSRTVAANAGSAATLTTYAAAITRAGLAPTLAGPGPFTVFAPTNAAFGRLAPGSMNLLWQPENRPTLDKLLTYLVIPGRMTLADLKQRIAAGNGAATLTSLEGEPVTVTLRDNAMLLTDQYGNKSYVEMPDVIQANGVVHVVNGILLPKLG